MMYRELYQYFIQHKNLDVPGIGTFLLERKPAQGDFLNKKINPPVHTIVLLPNSNSPSNFFFTWLADVLKISDSDAPVRFNDFVYEVKKKIDSGDTVNWKGIGILSKGLAGEIKFVPINEELVLEQPVPAVKMIRDNAEHTMRVGEQERTSSEMMEILMRPEKRTSYWWTYGLAVGLLAIMFIGWYFSEHGLDVSSTANGQKLVPKQIAPTYRELK